MQDGWIHGYRYYRYFILPTCELEGSSSTLKTNQHKSLHSALELLIVSYHHLELMEFLRCHVNVDVQISSLSHPVVSKVTSDRFLPFMAREQAATSSVMTTGNCVC